MQFVVEVGFILTSSKTRWYVPERDVCVLGLVQHQLETRPVPYFFGEILGVIKVRVDVSFQTVGSL